MTRVEREVNVGLQVRQKNKEAAFSLAKCFPTGSEN
jgi:hypothetical protein